MAGINFLGSYSGIDKSSIDQLMQVEKLPLVQLANKKTSITDKQNAWKDINTRLNSLFEKLKTLQINETFTAKTSKSSNEDMVTMSASKNAVEGTYRINVKQLATSTSYISKEIPLADGDITKVLGIDTGKFTITNADDVPVSRDIDVQPTDSLKSIAQKINDAAKDTKNADGTVTKGTGINATIIDSRLILTDSKTGARNITLNGYGNGTLTSLGLNMTARTENKGTNSIFTINGVEVERTTNSVSDAVEFVTINLTKAHAKDSDPKSVYDTVTVSQDTAKLTKAIQDFVDQYNSTMQFIEDKLAAGDPKVAATRGALAGDSSLQRLHSSLRQMVTSTIGNDNTDLKDISQLGVSTIDKFGKLQFDSSKLTKALSEDPQNVMNFFTSNVDGKEVGFAPRLKDYVNSFISSDKGIIKGKNESFDRSLKDLNKQIDNFNARMVKKEQYYTKMFAALDTAMMQAESQMSWLDGQISAMNGQNKK